jgi:hypothetical protein
MRSVSGHDHSGPTLEKARARGNADDAGRFPADATRTALPTASPRKEVSMIVEYNGRDFSLIEPMPSDSPSNRLGLLGVRKRRIVVPGALEVEPALRQRCTLSMGASL